MTDRNQSLWDEQVEAWGTFDEDDACKTCGAQVTEFNQVTHYRWHQRLGHGMEDE